jgi:hypothetical protein
MILDHPPGSPQRFVMSIKTLCRHTVPGAIRVLGYLVTTTCEVCGATVALATVEEVASAPAEVREIEGAHGHFPAQSAQSYLYGGSGSTAMSVSTIDSTRFYLSDGNGRS